jgi:hypothetical protein
MLSPCILKNKKRKKKKRKEKRKVKERKEKNSNEIFMFSKKCFRRSFKDLKQVSLVFYQLHRF